jgi:hypothetical protein
MQQCRDKKNAHLFIHPKKRLFVAFENKPELYDTFCFIIGYKVGNIAKVISTKNVGRTLEERKVNNEKAHKEAVDKKTKEQDAKKAEKVKYDGLPNLPEVSQKQLRECAEWKKMKKLNTNFQFTEK